MSLSSDLIEELCQRGIRIAFLSGGDRPFALLTSPLLNATVETRRAQFAAREGAIGAGIARWIVAGKLRNQERLLRYFARTREGPVLAALLDTAATLRRLRRSAELVEGETPDAVRPSLLGFEGAGGRLYWEQLSSLVPDAGFEGRVHRLMSGDGKRGGDHCQYPRPSSTLPAAAFQPAPFASRHLDFCRKRRSRRDRQSLV